MRRGSSAPSRRARIQPHPQTPVVSRRWLPRTAPRSRSSIPAAWVGHGRWTGSGSGSGSVRRSAGSPPVGAVTARPLSGWCSRWSRSAPWNRGRSWRRPAWVGERVAIDRLGGFTDNQACRPVGGWTSCSTRLDEIAAETFSSVAHLLNLDLDIVVVGTTSTYWETEVADDEADLAEEPGDDEITSPGPGQHPGVRALQGPPRRSAAGGDRDGGHPRRGPGAVLDLPRRHRRHRDHPHRQRRPGRVGAAAAGVGGRPRVRLRGQPRLSDPRRRALSSPPRSCATPTPRPPPRSPGPGATAPGPTTCGSRRSPSPPAETATRARGRSGS